MLAAFGGETVGLINLRGAYMNFEHDRQADWDFLGAWDPSVVRLMLNGSHTDPNSVDVYRIRRVYETAPNALILLRVWDVDDRNLEAHHAMQADPVGEANRQMDWWLRVLDRLVAVPRDRVIVGLNNEPHPRDFGPTLFQYTIHALMRGTADGVRVGCGCFSTGEPGKPGELPFDMSFYSQWEPAILAGDHFLVIHEYMQPEGMYAIWQDETGTDRHDHGNLIGRHTHWPMKAPKIIGEWGIDGLLFNRHRHPEYGHSGWKHFPDLWPAERYADEYVECCRTADPTVRAICPFISDWADPKWASFDLLPAYGALLERKHLCEREATTIENQQGDTWNVYIPAVNGSRPKGGGDMTDTWERSIAWILKEEGGFQANPADVGNYYQGKLIGTKYGISAKSWAHAYDIPNLTEEQAREIYYTHYWLASGANTLPWPLCVLVMDTAVLHGTGTAKAWLEQSGPNPFYFAAKRLEVYAKQDNGDAFWRGWNLRLARLLRAMSLDLEDGR